MIVDHHVYFKSETSIAGRTELLRAFSNMATDTKLSVTTLITSHLSEFLGKRGPVNTKAFDKIDKDGNFAFATFNPRTINYHRPIWGYASLGSPRHRLMLAHEIGHIDLHDGGAKPFLRDPTKMLKFDSENTSAEWQAIIYSYHLLMPDWALQMYDGADSLSKACQVELHIAEDRLRRNDRKLKTRSNDGIDFCRICGVLCDKNNSLYCSACSWESIQI